MIPSGLVRVICTIPLSNTTWKYSQRKNSKITSSLRHYRDKLWRIPESPTDPYGIPRCRNSKITWSLWAFLHDELKSLQNLIFSKGGKRGEGNRCKGCLHSGLDPRGGHQGPQFQCLLLVCAPYTTMPPALLEAHEILWESLLPTDVFVNASKKKRQPNSELSLNFAEDPTPDPTSVVRNPQKNPIMEKDIRLTLSRRLVCLSLCWHTLWQIDSTIPSFISRQIPCGMSPPSLPPPPSQCWPLHGIFQDSLLLQQKKTIRNVAFFSVLTHSTADSTLPSFLSRQIPHEMSPPSLSLSLHLCFCADTF